MPVPTCSRPSGRAARFAAIPVVTLALACGGEGGPSPIDAPSWDEAANAAYAGVYEEPVQLSGGAYEGEPFVAGAAARPRAGLVSDFRLVGDLDADGSAESAVLLWENSGGTGTFTFLAVLDRGADGVVSATTARVGDRVQVRSAGIEDGLVVLGVVQAGDTDAACCPGQKVTRTWRLGPDGLWELEAVDEGRMTLADLEGVEWVLRAFGTGEPLPDEPEVTLGFEDDRLAGVSGCNSYFASVAEGDAPGSLIVGPVGMTMMACDDATMDLEQRYQRLLGSVDSYSFVAGRLALMSVVDDELSTMLFDGRQPAED